MPRTLRADDATRARLADGLDRIRDDAGVPRSFPPAVQSAADRRVRSGPLPGDRVDLTHLPFATLDPASSTDLDQAFHVTTEGRDLVLHYAIADVSAFVEAGDAIDSEAWSRGVTVYAPDGSTPLYPRVISSDAASLLPDGDRPAVVLDVVVDADGGAVLRSARRAMVRSRAKLAYETTRPADLPDEVRELALRIGAAERVRGAFRSELPEQEVVDDPTRPGGIRLQFTPRRDAEDVNAGMSLAANLAVAAAMSEHGIGLYRVMSDPSARELAALLRTAATLGIAWPEGDALRSVVGRLDATDPRSVAFLLAARRAGGGASYAVRQTAEVAAGAVPAPWHAAMAAPYAHATAPMRRLADRHVLDLLCEQLAGRTPTPDALAALERLPAVMEDAERRASRVDREALDLAECLMLADAVGTRFDAVVIEVDPAGMDTVHIDAPAIRVRLNLRGVEPGDAVELRLTAIDEQRRRLQFQRTR